MEYRQHNWERQREQLSALLDNQLNEQERTELEAHLRDCAACQAELASLHQTRALLRALPQPVLPRAFTLPLDIPAQAPHSEPVHAHQPTSVRKSRQTPLPRPSTTRWQRPVQIMQWLSVTAAVIGLLILCSGALSSFPLRGGGASGAAAPGTYKNTSGTAPQATPPFTQPTSNTVLGEGTATATREAPAPTPTTAGSQHTAPGSSGEGPSGAPFQAFISVTGLAVLLLILGVCGFVIARVVRHRW